MSFKIRAVVEGNLPETLRRIPIEKRFNKNYVREVSEAWRSVRGEGLGLFRVGAGKAATTLRKGRAAHKRPRAQEGSCWAAAAES